MTLWLAAASCSSSVGPQQTGTGGAGGAALGGKSGSGGSAVGGSSAGGSAVGGSSAGGAAAMGGSSAGGKAAGGTSAGGGGAGGSSVGGAGGAGAGGNSNLACGVPTPATSPPYPTQFRFRNDGTVPLYVHEGCVGVDYGISSCASGFRDSLGPAFHCACACENSACTGGVACGACPADTAGTIAAGASTLVSWEAIVRTDEDRSTYTCVRSQPAAPGRYRVAIRVYDDAMAARDGIGGRLVTQDFELPAAGSLVEVPIATIASDACTMPPTGSTPACTGNEAHDQPCQLTLSMNYSYEGGLGAYYDTFWLASPNAYTLTRTYNTGTLTTRSCMAPLPICSRDGREVTTGDVTRVLTAPGVVTAFAKPTPVFGYDSRPTDGRILILRSPDGKSLGIGANTADKPVPQAMQDLQSVLGRLDNQMRVSPACAMLKP